MGFCSALAASSTMPFRRVTSSLTGRPTATVRRCRVFPCAVIFGTVASGFSSGGGARNDFRSTWDVPCQHSADIAAIS
jgi:hypothetical protein